MANIIMLGHRSRVGKDTVASMLLELDPSFQRLALTDPLKRHCCRKYDLNFFDDAIKVEHRQKLIDTSAELRAINDEVWMDATQLSIASEYVVITDLRDPKEIEYFRKQGHTVFLVHVDRPAVPERTDGIDNLLSDYRDWDHYISNIGNQDFLAFEAKHLYSAAMEVFK